MIEACIWWPVQGKEGGLREPSGDLPHLTKVRHTELGQEGSAGPGAAIADAVRRGKQAALVL